MNFDFLDSAAVIAGAVIYIFNEFRKEWRIKKGKKSKSLDDNMYIDSQIYPLLWEILNSYRSIRVYIVQFHNGTHFYTGQSIQRMTISHEVVHKGIRKIKDFYDNVLVSEMYHKILLDMRKGDYFLADRNKLNDGLDQDAELKAWMELYSLNMLYCFRIEDKSSRQTVATLNIHWNHTDPISPLELNEILDLKKKLESIFDRLC